MLQYSNDYKEHTSIGFTAIGWWAPSLLQYSNDYKEHTSIGFTAIGLLSPFSRLRHCLLQKMSGAELVHRGAPTLRLKVAVHTRSTHRQKSYLTTVDQIQVMVNLDLISSWVLMPLCRKTNNLDIILSAKSTFINSLVSRYNTPK